MAAAPAPHPDLGPLETLIGTWHGTGQGDYPSVDRFDYVEETSFAHEGEPFLLYQMRSHAPGGGFLHAEAGFWRPAGEGRLDVCLAHPLGHVEVAEGTIEDGAIELRSTVVGRAARHAGVVELTRRYEISGDALAYELWMTTDETPLAFHCVARLRRV